MSSIVKRALVVVLVLVLFGLPACDTGGGDGGGTTTAGTYSKASLAGVWDYVMTTYRNKRFVGRHFGTVKYDEQGNLISRTADFCGWYCGGSTETISLRDDMTVNSDGSYSGVTILACACQKNSHYKFIIDGEFTSTTTRESRGAMGYYSIAGVVNVTWYNYDIKYTKRQ